MLVDKYKYPLFEVQKYRDFRDMLENTVSKYPDKISFLEKEEDKEYKGITYREFYENVRFLGEFLLSKLKERDKIALIGKNCRNWAISYLSITTSNFIVVPIDKDLKEGEINAIVKKAKVGAVICENRFLEIFERIKQELPELKLIIAFDKNDRYEDIGKIIVEYKKNGNTERYDRIKLNPEDVNSILFTSGTTGTPKGAMLSQKNILTNIWQMLSLYYVDETDVFLSVLPLHHAYECTCGFLCPVYQGATIAYAQSLKKIADNLAESNATMMLGVPAIYEIFYRKIKEAAFSGIKGRILFGLTTFVCDVSEILFKKNIRKKVFKKLHNKFGKNLKRFISGGAALSPKVNRFFNKLGFLMVQGYGITECSPLLAVNRCDHNRLITSDPESAGVLAPYIDIEIFYKDKDGNGEFGVKGDNVMLGYYEEEELTKKAFHNGYFMTGDYGFIGNDNFIYILGRKKDVIVTDNGKNIYPDEIELNFKGSKVISEIAVLSGEDPKDKKETIFAVVYPDYDYLTEILNHPKDTLIDDKELFIDLIKEEIKNNNKKLSHYKQIKYFEVKEKPLDKTTKQSLQRFKIKISGKIHSVY